MKTHIVSLASGSKANCILVDYGNTTILIDDGLSSVKELNRRLEEVGLYCDISGVLITHEHIDHVKGLPSLALHTDIPVFMHPETYCAVASKYNINYCPRNNYESGFDIGEIGVQPFRTSHDAAYPLGYTLYCGDDVITLLTDSGYVSEGMSRRLLSSTVVLIESNHDDTMLRNGPYPPMLKQRILSRNGHLSNAACADALKKICERNASLQKVALMHLSEQNNDPTLAYNTAKSALTAGGRPDIDPIVTSQSHPVMIL